MRTVSAAYAPFSQVRQVDALISFEVLAKTLNKKDIDVTAPSSRLGNGAVTINGIPELARKYATVEKYGWPLDASCYIMPDAGAETGFWTSAVSDDAGNFHDPVSFRYDLPSDTVTFGWTFHFDTPGMVQAAQVKAAWFDENGDKMGEAEARTEGSPPRIKSALTVGIEAAQSGSGTPSPSNIRPISGWTGANITASPTLDAQDGTTYAVSWETEAGTVYGGTLDTETGVLTVTWEKQQITTVKRVVGNYAASEIGDEGYVVNYDGICNILSLHGVAPGSISSGEFTMFNSSSYHKAFVGYILPDMTGSTAAEKKASAQAILDGLVLDGTPMEVVYKLATPVTVQLSPGLIPDGLSQTDNIWADCGPVTAAFAPVSVDIVMSQNDDGSWSLHHYAAHYYSVEFTFYGTNAPLRMLRLAEVDFGVSKHFNRDSIKSARIKYGMAPDASAFPAKEIVFTFDNSNGDFNVLNPVGVYQYWRNGQVLVARLKVGDEIVPMGMFYVTKAEIGENRLLAKVTAHDPCYQLTNQKFYPLDLADETSVRLDEAVPRALIGTDLDVDYGGLGAEPVSVAVRDTHDKRVILRYLAQAARATCWIDRDNVLRFRRIETAEEEDGAISADELYDWSGVSIAEEYTGVTLTVRRELEEAEGGGEVTETYHAGVADDSGMAVAMYENPCVAASKGDDVAEWLLTMANRRKKYAVKNRCDPAVEIGDTLVIADAFRNDDRAVITGLDIEYDGGMSCVTEADREF